MLKILSIILIVPVVSGCNHLTISNFERSELSAVSGNKAGLSMQESKNDIDLKTPQLKKYIDKDKELVDQISSACAGEQKISPAAIPVIAAISKLFFDLQMDKSTKELEKLKKAAIGSYTQRVILPSESFNQHRCAIIYRYDKNTDDIGFISVIKFVKHGDVFTIKPAYIKAYNTVAITKKPNKDKDKAKINVSIAVATKVIGDNKNGLPGVQTIGAGVVTVPNIELSDDAGNPCSAGCEESDIIPIFSENGKYISVSFTVTETGKLGVDLDEKKAEYKAIKDAIGPAISEAVKGYYE